MNIITDEKLIDEILERSVAEILPSREEFKKKLMSGERMKIYIGTDATGTSLHLGHATNYIILEKFRKLGHEVIFLIGDFTSRIGDPTDKESVRKQLTREDVKNNVKTWLEQIKPIVDVDDDENPVRIEYNHKWLSKLTFEDIIDISSNFTVQQMLERDMFEKRMKGINICAKCEKEQVVNIKKNTVNYLCECGSREWIIGQERQPIYLHEFFYPLMQGYDSVELDVDVEMCGNDQKFNALVGRTLLKRYKNKEKFVFITTLLENPKTGEKMMSKSLGTGVYLDWDANQIYGGIMAQPDENMRQLFVDTTLLSVDEINEIIGGDNPRDIKMRLAFEVVKVFRSEDDAKQAQDYFVKTIQNKEIPDEVDEVHIESEMNIVDFMVGSDLATSKGDARRKIEQGGVSIDGEKVEDVNTVLMEDHGGRVMKVGKKNFRKIIFA
ncbi:tyrosine--tRNA ligase [Patescibacteria group bacterium]